MQETRQRAADWHGMQAAKAYRQRRYKDYARHATIADAIWKEDPDAICWAYK